MLSKHKSQVQAVGEIYTSIELSAMIRQPSGQPRWFRTGCELLILKLTEYVQTNCIE